MEAGSNGCGDPFYVFVDGGYCVGGASSMELVEVLHYFLLVHLPVAFVEALCGPDWVVSDVSANV